MIGILLKKIIMSKEISYHSKGIVLGNYWGGGSGTYTAREFTTYSLEELLKLNNKALKDGSLDSGMGYESLIGAIITVIITTKIVIEDKDFYNTEEEEHYVGELTEEQIKFLEQCYYE